MDTASLAESQAEYLVFIRESGDARNISKWHCRLVSTSNYRVCSVQPLSYVYVAPDRAGKLHNIRTNFILRTLKKDRPG